MPNNLVCADSGTLHKRLVKEEEEEEREKHLSACSVSLWDFDDIKCGSVGNSQPK
jgi:hypothetical protein